MKTIVFALIVLTASCLAQETRTTLTNGWVATNLVPVDYIIIDQYTNKWNRIMIRSKVGDYYDITPTNMVIETKLTPVVSKTNDTYYIEFVK